MRESGNYKDESRDKWPEELEEQERRRAQKDKKPPHKISGKSVFEIKKRIEERGREFR